MTEPVSYQEECFSVYWKIKNFSYCCNLIQSPEFSFSGDLYRLRLFSKSLDIECDLYRLTYDGEFISTIQISFHTCDSSPKESTSAYKLQVPKDVIFGERRNAFLPEDTLTVRFRSPTDSERGKVFIYSQIGVTRKYFLWSLNDFSKLKSNTRKSVEKSESYGNIELNFKSMGGNNATEQFGIEISRIAGCERCYCMLKIDILDVDGKAVTELSDEFVFFENSSQQTRGFPLIIQKIKLLANENLLLPNDRLTLKCEFAISLGKVTDQTAVTSYCDDITPLLKESDDSLMIFKEKNYSGCVTELQTDLKIILEDGSLHDASLQIGSEVIRVHKTILSARSSVFRAMFAKDMKEANSSTVVIEDFDVETVRALVLYIYTDSLADDQWENVKKLYYAADKYEVLSLKEKCVSFLKTNLSISNVCEALILADLHQDVNLETAVLDFISLYDSAVFASEAWKKLEKTNSSLALQVLREICCNKRFKWN